MPMVKQTLKKNAMCIPPCTTATSQPGLGPKICSRNPLDALERSTIATLNTRLTEQRNNVLGSPNGFHVIKAC